MRQIKFRAWDKEQKRMVFDFETIPYFASRVITKYSIDDCMQFTGLIDKNGKEIYEGDIINGWRVVIEPHSTGLRDSDNKWQGQIAHRSTGLEVIGNIYENTELLNARKN